MSRTLALVLISSAILVSGCKKDIEKSQMDAVAAWSTAVCACTTKACADALTKPKSVGQLASGNIYDTFTRESIQTYDQIHTTGDVCEAKLK
jgi:hypothetical protein